MKVLKEKKGQGRKCKLTNEQLETLKKTKRKRRLVNLGDSKFDI